MAHEGYHEPAELLSAETKDLHRGLISLIEELEAIDWYQQRVDACTDDELRQVLVHNRNEEIEHACMTLEWLRRRSPDIDQRLKRYLFVSGPIVAAEEEEKAESMSAKQPLGLALGIGSLRGGVDGSTQA